MPSSTLYAQRTIGAVSQSTMAGSATSSIGSRLKGFPARGRNNTVTGGDFVVASIVVTPASATLATTLGTVQLTASPRCAAGDVLADIPTWNSATPAAATVNANGLVTGVATGSSNVKATSTVDSNLVAITVP